VVVPPEQPQALAEAIIDLANTRTRVSELAANSLRAAPHYSREKQAREMLSVLAEVAERKDAFTTAVLDRAETL
jgi:glycosyltransferase involved in cell wall biosynthesis